ncbi:hypothetical protein GX586_05560 [bacterium]|nr:hypothetical protein [bacterium]
MTEGAGRNTQGDKAATIVLAAAQACVLVLAGLALLSGWRYWYVPHALMQRTPLAGAPVKGAPHIQTPPGARTPSGVVIVQHAAAAAPAPRTPVAPVVLLPNLLKNGTFAEGLASWYCWQGAKEATNAVKAVVALGRPALRIENPEAKLIGMQQLVTVESGVVYRLSGAARSVATTDSSVLFGGRLAFYLPPQPEREVVWMSEATNWWEKAVVFTNEVTGVATVFVHMGYGGARSTGEFTNIRLECQFSAASAEN